MVQIIEKGGRKEFAVIPYKDYMRMQEQLEDYSDLMALREAKADPRNQKRRPIEEVAAEMGHTKRR